VNEPNETQFHTEPESTDVPQDENTGTEQSASQSQWDAVAQDFQRLGESIADAVKSVWSNPSTQKQVTDLKEGLQNMAEQVGQVVDETRQNLTGEELKSEVRKATDDVKEFGTKVVSDSKPFLLDVLKTLDDGLQSLISRLEAREAPAEPSSPPPEDTPPTTDDTPADVPPAE